MKSKHMKHNKTHPRQTPTHALLAEALRQRVLDNTVSQTARDTGIGRSDLSAAIHGRRRITINMIDRMLRALKLELVVSVRQKGGRP